jgi:RNA-binding protein 39
MRADERDVRRFFRRKIGVKVNDVCMLRDKRSGRHKGFCYVELARLEDVIKAVALNNTAPDFQRFPILIKASEAEKNYTVPSAGAASLMGKTVGRVVGPNGKIQEAQKAYVGNLDPSVTQEHIRALFSSFGTLDKVMLQTDTSTGLSKGFCFLSYRDAKDANLAIQTMSGQTFAGRPLKTGWANQTAAISPNVEYVTTIEFPDDAPTRIQNAHLVLAQLAGSGMTSAPLLIVPPVDVASTAEAAINAALGLPANAAVAPVSVATPASDVAVPASQMDSSPKAVPQVALTSQVAVDAKVVGGADNPTKAILVHNMFDKDEETEPNWEEEIRLDFEDECAKYGVSKVIVVHKEAGGKVYGVFETVDGAKSCATSLAGRWFAKRQLRVEFVAEDAVTSLEIKSETSE